MHSATHSTNYQHLTNQLTIMPTTTREFTEDEIQRAHKLHQHYAKTNNAKKVKRRALMRDLFKFFNKNGFKLKDLDELLDLMTAIQLHIDRNDLVAYRDNMVMKPKTAVKKGLKYAQEASELTNAEE